MTLTPTLVARHRRHLMLSRFAERTISEYGRRLVEVFPTEADKAAHMRTVAGLAPYEHAELLVETGVPDPEVISIVLHADELMGTSDLRACVGNDREYLTRIRCDLRDSARCFEMASFPEAMTLFDEAIDKLDWVLYRRKRNDTFRVRGLANREDLREQLAKILADLRRARGMIPERTRSSHV